jgi:radical SAM superfamily enzyme YgiQ (UPF0313 family)
VNALLVCPEFPDTFWSFKYALKFVRKRSSLPPLGLLTVAAILPDHWTKQLRDLNVCSLTAEDLEWADCVFVGAMAIQRESVKRVLARCREAGVRTVAGGPLFTSEPDSFPTVDHLVLNEAELTLPELLRDLQSGSPKRVYETNERSSTRASPPPLWEIAELNRYASMSIQYSRGCPFDCEFCNVTALFGHRPRVKTAAQIVAELDGLYELGWRGRVFFVDDNLIGNRRRLRTELLPALIEWRRGKRGFQFYTEASIDLADDPSLMAMMVEAGFDTVFVGVETPSEESLAECSKKQNRNRDLVEDVKRIQRAGMQVQGGFIVGFDSDTPTIFDRQIDFIQRSGIVTAMVGLLQAPTGTRLYSRLAHERRLLGPMSGNNVDGSTNIVPRMDVQMLMEGYRRILRRIYRPRAYYRRVRTFLREYGLEGGGNRSLPTRGDVLASIHSAVRLGILGKERFQYWMLLSWTLFRRPRLLPLAITLAITGYHCRRICDNHLRPPPSRECRSRRVEAREPCTPGGPWQPRASA